MIFHEVLRMFFIKSFSHVIIKKHMLTYAFTKSDVSCFTNIVKTLDSARCIESIHAFHFNTQLFGFMTSLSYLHWL